MVANGLLDDRAGVTYHLLGRKGTAVPDITYYVSIGVAIALVIYSIILHEIAHAYAAFRLGDPTAAMQGRLTLNPIKHIDPFHTILIPMMTFYFAGFIFGGARPVPINPYNFRNMRKGMMISGIAGSFQTRFATPDVTEPVTGGVEWTDASRALKCLAPVGWRLSGGVQPFDKVATIQIKATRDDGRAWFVWAQPVRPMLRELTEAMHRLGFRNGDPYYAYDGTDARMVMTRGTPADLLAAYLLPDKIVPMPEGSAPGASTDLGNTGLLGHAGEQSALVEVAQIGDRRPVR